MFFWHYLKLLRPLNLAVLIFTQILVYLTLPEPGCWQFPLDARFCLLILATLFLASAGYVINDYFDAKIDLINKPDKMVLDTRISRRYAIGIHVVLNIAAILIGFFLSLRLGVFNIGIALALLIYSMSLKKRFLIGNLFVAAMMGLVVFVVWLFDQGLDFNLTLYYSIFAFMSGLLREIVKDIEDMEGDERFGCLTMPVVLGIYKTKNVIAALGLVFLLFLGAFVVFAFYHINNWLAFYLILAVIFPSFYFLYSLKKADTKKTFSNLSSQLKLIMVLGILSLLLVCV